MADKTEDPDQLRDFGWDEVVPMLLKAQGINSGLWSFGLRFSLAAINAGPGADQIMPSAIASARGLTLRPVDQPGPLVFDAATMKRVAPGPARSGGDVAPPPKARPARAATKKPATKKR